MNKMGFGFLRLPHTSSGTLDMDLLNQMVDAFLERGGTYFDTAYTYLGGQSEIALREAVVKRHPRDRFQIADKLPSWMVHSTKDCQRYFHEQRERCGVDFFDVYLLHWLNQKNYEVCERYDEFAFLRELKAQGKVGKIGFSYHDSAALLDEILTAHPETEIVQLQLNYADWDSAAIEGRKCYDTAVRHGKSIVVMEPVKGGTLAKLPQKAEDLLKAHRPDSPARWALRFVHSLPQANIILSGMSNLEQVLENMEDIAPLSGSEQDLITRVAEIIEETTFIACTGCRYCTADCPRNIPVPDFFAMYNACRRNPQENWKIQPVYQRTAADQAKASECIQCGQCESHCPQRLSIISYLKQVADMFE